MVGTFKQRLAIAAKAAVGVFSENAATQAYGLLAGINPGGMGQPPQRGTQEYLRAYSQMPWLRAVASRVATKVSTAEWQLYVTKKKEAPKAYRNRVVQRAKGLSRRTLIKSLSNEGELTMLTEHPLLELLHDANSFQTGEEMRKVTQLHLDLVGEAFWLKERASGGPLNGVIIGLWPIPPDWVINTPTPTTRMFRVSFKGWRGQIPDTEFLWMKDPDPANPYARGSGTAQSLADELETDEYAAKHTKAFFYNQARPDILVYPKNGQMREPDVKRLEDDWISRNSGFWRAFKPYFLTREVGVHSFDQNFRAMQLTQIRQYERDSVIQTFGMPPELLGILSSSNRATITAADLLFSRYVVEPRLEMLRTILQERLVPEFDERLVLDFVSPVQDDKDFQLQIASAAPWVLELNEYRTLMGLPEMEDEMQGRLRAVPAGIALKDFDDPATFAPPPAPGGPVPPGAPGAPGAGVEPEVPAEEPKPAEEPEQKPKMRLVPKFDASQPRDEHGRWSPSGSGASTTDGSERHVSEGGTSTSHAGGVVPGDRARFDKLKGDWSRINDELLATIDNPESPAAKEKMAELKNIVKEIHTLKADPGDIEGIGLPGGPRDILIVGAGPGGLAAGIMGGTDGLDTLIVDAQEHIGGQAKHSSRVENYPGFPVGVSGETLAGKMYEQTQRLGAETKLGTRVTGIEHDPETGLKTVHMSDGSKVEARTVILAGGVEFAKASFPGADSKDVIVGDGKMFTQKCKNGTGVVVGGSNGAAQAALGAAQHANEVHLVSRSPIAKSMSDYQVRALQNHPKITVHENAQVMSLSTDLHGNALMATLSNGKTVPCKSLGMFVGGKSNTDWMPAGIAREGGKVKVNRDLETTMPGVFAVGDMRSDNIGRIGAAVGDGQLAVRNTFEYFKRMPKGKKK